MHRPLDTVGPYRLEQELGSGAMGVVWRALHVRRGVRAALKLLPTDRPGSAVAAIRREVEAIGRLDHPNVVALYDQGEAGDPWLAMELAEGTVGAPSTWAGLRRVLDDVLAGLGAAHAAGLLHLDIKPSNVLVQGDRHLLADFGIAWGLSVDDSRGVWGSPGFMAPEAFDARRDRLSRATDLYSVGCLAWTLATRAPLFAGPPDTVGAAQRGSELPDFRPRLPVPPGFEDWLRTLLRKRPTERFQCASIARAALLALPEPSVIGSPASMAPIGPTLTACSARVELPPAALEPLCAPPTGPTCPPRWEPAPDVDGWARGCGLVGLQAVPWLDRPGPQDALWGALRALYRGTTGVLTVGGCPGSGRTRLVKRFLAEAHRRAGSETLWVQDDLGAALRTTFGDTPVALAVRLARRVDEVSELVGALHDAPEVALAALPALLHAPLVVGWDRSGAPPAVDGLVVHVVDGPSDIRVEPFDRRSTRRLLAAWASLDPQAVADVCNATDGDLDASVRLVSDGIAHGRFAQSERGWRPLPGAELAVDDALLARWEGPVSAVMGTVDPATLARVSVLGEPGEEVWDDAQRGALAALERAGLAADGRWVSAVGRRALLAALGDVAVAHREAAARKEGWFAGEHLLDAGDVDACSHLLLDDAWRLAARGQMARVQAVLTRLEPLLRTLPDDDVRHGKLALALARLGATHQGYGTTRSLAERALELARANGHAGPWKDVGRGAMGHLLHQADVQLHPAGSAPLIAEHTALHGEEAHFLDLRAWIALREGDPWTTMRLAHRAAVLADASGKSLHARLASRLLYWVGATHTDHPEAEVQYASWGRRFLDAGFHSAAMDVAVVKGDVARRRGFPERARPVYAEGLRIASEGEARADLGPWFGAALCERDLGNPERALELLEAARVQLGDAGPSWHALTDLFTGWVRCSGGLQVDLGSVERAATTLETTGFLDEDVLAAYTDLVPLLPSLVPVLQRATDRVEGFRARDAARGPMPELPAEVHEP